MKAECYFGERVVNIDITATTDVHGGTADLVALYSETEVVEFSYAELPAITAGDSFSFLLRAQGPAVDVVVDLYGPAAPDGTYQVDEHYERLTMPTCPRSPTAPTATAAVEGCADEDSGGSISVTITNPPGGPEYDMDQGSRADRPD